MLPKRRRNRIERVRLPRQLVLQSSPSVLNVRPKTSLSLSLRINMTLVSFEVCVRLVSVNAWPRKIGRLSI